MGHIASQYGPVRTRRDTMKKDTIQDQLLEDVKSFNKMMKRSSKHLETKEKKDVYKNT